MTCEDIMRCGRLIEIIDWKFSGEAFGRVFSFRGAYAPLIFFLHIPLTKTSPSEEKKAPLWRKKSAPRKSVSAHKFTSAPQKRYRDTVWWKTLMEWNGCPASVSWVTSNIITSAFSHQTHVKKARSHEYNQLSISCVDVTDIIYIYEPSMNAAAVS